MKMKNNILSLTLLLLFCASGSLSAQNYKPQLTDDAAALFGGKQLLFIERKQYGKDHHNSATLFQAGEINESKFAAVAGSAMRICDLTSGTITTLVECAEGVVRDPELSFDGGTIIFSMRHNIKDDYHLYEIGVDGKGLKQLTFAKGVSDIDPLYLPDGGVVFSSTRQPKYCMCNRHIMCNLFRMNGDGSNITQIGVSTLFEGHSTLMSDGRILYDRWEYVDRNFANAQALWSVNPDGTKHSIYYGNNTSAPDGVFDARQIPRTELVVAIFGNCHERPQGALAILDRRKGVDGQQSVVKIYPEMARDLIGSSPMTTDVFRAITRSYEDPYPLDDRYILASRTIKYDLTEEREKNGVKVKASIHALSPGFNPKMGVCLIDLQGEEHIILEGELSLFDPMIIEPRYKPQSLPVMRNYSDTMGSFYVQDVYEGTHMHGVERGTIKYLRLVESLEKRTYTAGGWHGEGEQAPAMNWHNFDAKRVISEVAVEEDGSAYFEAPAGKFLYFQLLDEDRKMVQTMRSGVSLMPGEVNGCVGCHENRLDIPMPQSAMPMALRRPIDKINGWRGQEPKAISFMELVQPILNNNCVSCHDFDLSNRDKLVLAADRNHVFNAAYMNLYVNKVVKLIGGGPAELQPPYSWGSHASPLTEIIDGEHNGVTLTEDEKQILYGWMDLNGSYYPTYDSAFDKTVAGRSPLTKEESAELEKLLGYNYSSKREPEYLNGHTRTLQSQISFDRPEMSPCLDKVRHDKAKYERVLEIIRLGGQRLESTPRGDIEQELVLCDRHQEQIRRYIKRMEGEDQNSCNIDITTRRYDEN